MMGQERLSSPTPYFSTPVERGVNLNPRATLAGPALLLPVAMTRAAFACPPHDARTRREPSPR